MNAIQDAAQAHTLRATSTSSLGGVSLSCVNCREPGEFNDGQPVTEWHDEDGTVYLDVPPRGDALAALTAFLQRHGTPAAVAAPAATGWKEGDRAIWKGTKGLFRQEVTIATVRTAYLVTLGQGPEDGKPVCDINHPDHGLVFSIPVDQLEPVPVQDGET